MCLVRLNSTRAHLFVVRSAVCVWDPAVLYGDHATIKVRRSMPKLILLGSSQGQSFVYILDLLVRTKYVLLFFCSSVLDQLSLVISIDFPYMGMHSRLSLFFIFVLSGAMRLILPSKSELCLPLLQIVASIFCSDHTAQFCRKHRTSLLQRSTSCLYVARSRPSRHCLVLFQLFRVKQIPCSFVLHTINPRSFYASSHFESNVSGISAERLFRRSVLRRFFAMVEAATT